MTEQSDPLSRTIPPESVPPASDETPAVETSAQPLMAHLLELRIGWSRPLRRWSSVL